jgi:PAS domain S-box-containing protein
MAASREQLASDLGRGNFCAAQALDAVRNPILVIDISDARFNIIFANAAIRDLLGVQDSAIVGAPIGHFLELSSIEPFAKSIRQLSASRNSQIQKIAWRLAESDGDLATEFKLLGGPQSGSSVMLTLPSVNKPARPFPQGSPSQPAGWEERFNSDITDEKTARQTLNRLTEWLKLSMRAAHMYAWRWDRAGDEFDFVLPEDVAHLLPPDFCCMEGFFARLHPDDKERMAGSVQLALEECVEIKEEFRFRMGDDSYRWYATVGRPMLNDTGEVCSLVGATQDVTNRRSTQARVREYSELLRTATANTADVLLLLDADLNVRFCNRSIGGFNPQEMLGRSAQSVMRGSDWNVQSQLLRSVLNGAESVAFGHEALGEDGAMHRYEGRAIPVYDKGVISGLSLTVADITERMRLEREILEISTREQERIGQDLHDGLGQELTGVALMLRSLSNKIRRDYPNATEDVDEIIGVVNHSIESTRSLARGLSPVNSNRGGLVHALRALAVRSRDLYALNVRFRSKVWPQLTLDETCSSHLYRIAQEALTNIARHAQASRADVRLQVTDGKFELSIEDDGVGVHRSFKSVNGMGLKLMAYRAGMIGAKLEIAANDPKGTIVRICGEQPPVM